MAKPDADVLISPVEAERAAEAVIAKADEQRASALETLALVQHARAQVLSRDVERLKGVADDRAAVLGQVVEATESTAQQIGLEAKRSRLVQPEPSRELAKVYGQVLDEQQGPVRDATVQVVDSTGKQVRGASATTDDEGSFVLEWKPPAPKDGEQQEVRLRVVEGRTSVLHEDDEPRERPAGSVEYREIVVAKERE